MIELFLPPNWHQDERNLNTRAHSETVAIAAQKIAEKSSGILDPKKAYTYGLMHDIGKFYLCKNESYKHPLLGYMMLKDSYLDVAEICVSHPFPNFEAMSHIQNYCGGDMTEAHAIASVLRTIQKNDYIELIQLCDKISGLHEYNTIEGKIDWYVRSNKISITEMKDYYTTPLNLIKQKFDRIIGMDIYKLLGI